MIYRHEAAKPVVVDYRPDWPERAASLISALASRLGPLATRIEHIGSTSIPGMAAKDIIDVQVSTTDLEAAAAAFAAPLRDLGFEASLFGHDHVPAGWTDDPGRWVKRLWSRRDHRDGDVNLHVRIDGSPNARLALLFRDWFRAHPEAIPAYAEFKRSLARVTKDTGDYSEAKDPVVDLVIVFAEAWATCTRWQP